jgi:tetratricopeptide (TPR) repeat protein
MGALAIWLAWKWLTPRKCGSHNILWRIGLAKQNVLTRAKKTKAAELFDRGQLQEAETLYQKVCQIDPGDTHAWVMRAVIKRKLGLPIEAEDHCRKALALNPHFAQAHHQLGAALECQGKRDQALSSYKKAIQLQPDFAEAHYFLANALRDAGALPEAVSNYRQAIEIQPDFVEALSNLGAALTLLGDIPEAVKVLNLAVTLRPNAPQILCNLGNILQRDGRLAEALDKYQHALLRNPDSMDAITNVAALLEKTNRLEEAQALVDRELPRYPDNPDLLLVAARLARRENRLDDAIELLETALKNSAGSDSVGVMHTFLGQLYDRKGDAERAFAHLAEGNSLTARTMGSEVGSKNKYLERVERMRTYLTPELATLAKTDLVENDAVAPVFLFGFPRSGTTLLEQILDSHPALQSLEEKPTVSVMVQAFEEMAQGRNNALAELTQEQVFQLRTIYFDEVARHLQLQPGRQLVDKSPLNTINVHLLWRIFPQAKFILALRHPCDACFSCFMQNFTLNEAMSSFMTIVSSAAVYSHVMRIWMEAVRCLPLDYHRVRYEDLVTDFEKETRALLDFLGAGWDDRVLGHTEHAIKRGTINTPSYHQVTQPIYQHAKYRWKRYAKQFEPVMPELQPFIDYFGYKE